MFLEEPGGVYYVGMKCTSGKVIRYAAAGSLGGNEQSGRMLVSGGSWSWCMNYNNVF